ncbi:MAG: sodium/substrate symporter small subunit [Rhodomicrobium sp.]
MSDGDTKQAYWRRMGRLTLGMALLIAGLTIILPVFVPFLNSYRFLRFPLGYFIISGAAPVVLAILLYAFFGGQQKSDRIYNMTIQF